MPAQISPLFSREKQVIQKNEKKQCNRNRNNKTKKRKEMNTKHDDLQAREKKE